MHLGSQLGEALDLLHDNRVRQASLLNSLGWVGQLLRWEASLQLIRPRSSRPGCINEGSDVTHSVVHVEPGDHASAIG